MSAAGKMLPVFGKAMGDMASFSGAEIAVLQTLALAEKLNARKENNWAVRLSNQTRKNELQPWFLTVHSRTAHNLAEKSRPFVEITMENVGGKFEDRVNLTEAGHLALVAIKKATKKSATTYVTNVRRLADGVWQAQIYTSHPVVGQAFIHELGRATEAEAKAAAKKYTDERDVRMGVTR